MEDAKKNEEIIDEIDVTEEEAPATEEVVEEAEPVAQELPDYGAMIAELDVKIEKAMAAIAQLQDAYALFVEAGAIVREDSTPAAEEAAEAEDYTPLEGLNYL